MVGVQRTSNRSLGRVAFLTAKSMLPLMHVPISCTAFPLVSGTKLVRRSVCRAIPTSARSSPGTSPLPRKLARKYFERFPEGKLRDRGRELAPSAVGEHRVHHEAVAGAGGSVPAPIVHRTCLKTALYKSFNLLDNYGLYPELSTMRTPWTLSTIEAAIFLALVLVLAGAGTWASAIG